jgi:hypothetical protein
LKAISGSSVMPLKAALAAAQTSKV